MKRRKAICVLMLLLFAGCGPSEFTAQEAILSELRDQKASQDAVLGKLGPGHVLYERGDEHWHRVLVNIAKGDQETSGRILQKFTNSNSVVMYSTPSMQTWLFFNENEQITDFLLDNQ